MYDDKDESDFPYQVPSIKINLTDFLNAVFTPEYRFRFFILNGNPVKPETGIYICRTGWGLTIDHFL